MSGLSHNRAQQINEAHRAGNTAGQEALKHCRRAFEHYYRAGVLLNEEKAEQPHGAWLPWLEANFEGDPRTAQRYMRLADNWPAIQAKYDSVSHLSLSKALMGLTGPKEEPKELEERKHARDLRGEEAVRKLIIPQIRLAKSLAAIRDHKLYRNNYAAFEDYCLGRWQMDAELLSSTLEIIHPESILTRDNAIGLMLERNLTFAEAIDHMVSEFHKHLASAA